MPGEANHAGTTALADREDAMLGLAAMVIAARRAAEEQGCVATVGKVHVVPGRGQRHREPRHRLARRPRRRRGRRAARRSPRCATWSPTSTAWSPRSRGRPTTDFDPALVRRLRDPARRRCRCIGTGAGHDAGILANDGIRSAMLFVRNPTGVSHSPDEWASADDCLDGIAALADVVTDLAGAGA